MNLVECALEKRSVWCKSEKTKKINFRTFERVRYWIQKTIPNYRWDFQNFVACVLSGVNHLQIGVHVQFAFVLKIKIWNCYDMLFQ